MLLEKELSNLESRAFDENEFDLLDLLIVLGKHKHLVFGMPTLLGLLSLAIGLLIPPAFTSTTTLLPPQQQSSGMSAVLGQFGGLAGLAGDIPSIKSPDDLYVAILRSRTVADSLVKQFGLQARYGSKTVDDACNNLAAISQISAEKKDGLISISVSDRDPKFAADLANGYVKQLTRLTQTMAVTDAARRRIFFERQMRDAKEQLINAENALVTTQQNTGIIQPEGQLRMLISTVAEMKGKIAAKEVQLNSMRTFASAQNPDFQRAQEELHSLQMQLAKMENSGGSGGHGLSVSTGQVPTATLDYVRSLRNVKYYETIFELLAKQYELAKVDEAKDTSMIQVLDKAVPAERKSRPKTTFLIFAGVALGGVLGALLAFLRESWVRSQENPKSQARWQVLKSVWKV